MAVLEQQPIEVSEPGWFPDPQHRHNLRYFDGSVWTEHVTHYGPTPCAGCGYDPSVMLSS